MRSITPLAVFPDRPLAVIWLRRFKLLDSFHTLYGAQISYAQMHHAFNIENDSVRARIYIFKYISPEFGPHVWLKIPTREGLAAHEPTPVQYGLTGQAKGSFGLFEEGHLHRWHHRLWKSLSDHVPHPFHFVVATGVV